MGARGLAAGDTTRLAAPAKPSIEVTATARHGPSLSGPIVGDVVGFALRRQASDGVYLWITGDTVPHRPPTQRLARYYLRSLEMTAKSEPEPWFIPQDDPTIISLEHVLPRKPDGEPGWNHFTEEDARLHATRIGNLALLAPATTPSSRASRSTTSARYMHNPLRTHKPDSRVCILYPDTIVERQKRLAELAVATWPLPTKKSPR